MDMSRFSTIARNKEGILLYEVLLALAILSFGLVAVLGSFNTSLRAVTTSENYFRATLLLEEKLWELEMDDGFSPGVSRGGFPGEHSKFRWQVEASPIEEEGDMVLNEVKVTISWNERNKRRDMALTTWMVKEIE